MQLPDGRNRNSVHQKSDQRSEKFQKNITKRKKICIQDFGAVKLKMLGEKKYQ